MAAIGWPITTSISAPTMKVDTSGMTTTGMMPAMPRGTLIRLMAMTTAPASRPAIRPPRNPALISTEIRPPTMPATRAGRSPMA